PVEFLERQQIGFRQEGHVFRHTIEAAEVAAVGDRYPQVCDRPAERVGHRARQRRRGTRKGSIHSTGLVTARCKPPMYASCGPHTIASFRARPQTIAAQARPIARLRAEPPRFSASAYAERSFFYAPWAAALPVAAPQPPDSDRYWSWPAW